VRQKQTSSKYRHKNFIFSSFAVHENTQYLPPAECCGSGLSACVISDEQQVQTIYWESLRT
jgi:hypothetical protein